MSDLHRWHRSELQKLKADMEELFDSFVQDFCSPNDLRLLRCDPAVHITTEDSCLVVTVAIPDLDPQSLKVTLHGSKVVISGTKMCTHRHSHGYTTTRHRFSTTVQLPCSVNQDRVDAVFKDGILRIELPKCSDQTPLRVTVNTQEPVE